MSIRGSYVYVALFAGLVFAGCKQDGNLDNRAGRAARDTVASTSELVGDAWITTKVQARYFTERDVKGSRIDVSTEDGVVTLKGRVESEQARQRAVRIARETDGVQRVQDQLRVDMADAGQPATGTAGESRPGEPSRAAIDDNVIATRLRAELYKSETLHSEPIEVDVAGGIVTLSGTVHGRTQHEEALRLARETQGVNDVRDDIREARAEDEAAKPVPVVKPPQPGAPGTAPQQPGSAAQGQRLGDDWIKTKITSSFFMDDLVRHSRIDVSSQDGTVTLSGTVDSEAARQRAMEIARRTEGVRDVVDRMQVGG